MWFLFLTPLCSRPWITNDGRPCSRICLPSPEDDDDEDEDEDDESKGSQENAWEDVDSSSIQSLGRFPGKSLHSGCRRF